MRVQILKDFVKQHFSSTQLLDYALEVEKITTSKVGTCAGSCRRLLVYSPDWWLVSLSETQLDSECGRLHWRGLCGPAADLWWLH